MCFFVGENGSGKSTLIEAIAESYGFGREGGSRNFYRQTVRYAHISGTGVSRQLDGLQSPNHASPAGEELSISLAFGGGIEFLKFRVEK